MRSANCSRLLNKRASELNGCIIALRMLYMRSNQRLCCSVCDAFDKHLINAFLLLLLYVCVYYCCCCLVKRVLHLKYPAPSHKHHSIPLPSPTTYFDLQVFSFFLKLRLDTDNLIHSIKVQMETFSGFFKSTVPSYFSSLPLPSTIGGFAKLSGTSCSF